MTYGFAQLLKQPDKHKLFSVVGLVALYLFSALLDSLTNDSQF